MGGLVHILNYKKIILTPSKFKDPTTSLQKNHSPYTQLDYPRVGSDGFWKQATGVKKKNQKDVVKKFKDDKTQGEREKKKRMTDHKFKTR